MDEPSAVDSAVRGDYADLHGNFFSGKFDCPAHGHDQPAAAGRFHPHDMNRTDRIAGKNPRQLFRIINAVKLCTSDDKRAAAGELSKRAVRKGCAVRRDHQFTAIEGRRRDRNLTQFQRPASDRGTFLPAFYFAVLFLIVLVCSILSGNFSCFFFITSKGDL